MEKNIALSAILATTLILGSTNIVLANNHDEEPGFQCGFDDPNENSRELDDCPEENDRKHKHSDNNDREYDRNCKPNAENYEECGFSAKLDIFITYDEHPLSYYHQAEVRVNDVHKEINFAEFTITNNTAYIDYYFDGYEPYESVVCVENLDSGNAVCDDVYKGDKEIFLPMPD